MAEQQPVENQPESIPDPRVEAGGGESTPSDRASWTSGELFTQLPGWLVSMLVHMAIMIGLALITLDPPEIFDISELLAVTRSDDPTDELDDFALDPIEESIDLEITEEMSFTDFTQPDEIEVSAFDEPQAMAVTFEPSDIGLEAVFKNDLLSDMSTYSGNAFSGRGSNREWLAIQEGGTKESELAVGMALKWLARHQMNDGGWSFDHTLASSCRGKCRDPGRFRDSRAPGGFRDSRIGATGLALLPFLGAGQTQKEGIYRKQVREGLYFLRNHMNVTPNGGSLWEPGGQMYSHGIAAITLCEAWAMTKDRDLQEPAQLAINYICFAQDPIGGGWRYTAQSPGDTSVVGWQLMALKSGFLGYLYVPSHTIARASMFLDNVQTNNGANYGYVTRGQGEATTAVGLLCRMYLGWKKDNAALQEGVEWLGELGPSPTDSYYNYYATQVMRHYEGPHWEKWNAVIRDQLVDSQATEGHEAGSWAPAANRSEDHGAEKGGRLYTTSMATMTLEVYYRHLPIYRKKSTEQDFPLD